MRYGLLFATIVLPLAVGACAPAPSNVRIELPQQYRMPQASLVTTFERRSGRIALIDDSGNLVVMDQTGGGVVKITRDATEKATSAPTSGQTTSATRSKVATGYHWPVWSPDASQIAFVELVAERVSATRIIETGVDAVTVQRGPNSTTIQQSEDGTASQRSPNTTSVLHQPSRVIIESDPTGNILSNAIYIAHIDGKSPLQEVYASEQYAVGYLDWSPDNSQIAFLAQTGDTEVSLHLARAGNDPGKPRKVATGVNATWNWHPDGKTLVAKVEGSMTDNTADLSLLDAQSDATVSTIIKKTDIPIGSPAFSSDGNAMLVTTRKDGQEYLALADRQGNILRNLVAINGQVSFSWSPAAAKVAYIVKQDSGSAPVAGAPASSGGALHLLDVNSGEDRVLSQMPVLAFFWSPDGERLATFSPVRLSDMSKDFAGVDLTSNQPSGVMTLQTIDVNTRTFRQLFYLEPTTEFRRLLNQFDRFNRSLNIWSPDSRSLVFSIYNSDLTNNPNLIVETEATGSIQPRFIAQGTVAVWSPR